MKFIKLHVKLNKVGRGHTTFDYKETYFNVDNISFSNNEVYENGLKIEVKESCEDILKLINNE